MPIPVTPAQIVFHAGGAVIVNSATIRQYCQEAAAAAGLGPQGWAYLYSICQVESSLGTDLSPSPAGAEGPMQFLPSTWAEYGAGSVFDLRDSIMAAARMLRANGAPGDWLAAVYQYNHSRDYVREVVAGADRLLAGQ
ncbi:MAG: lytic transglycosylase domain-containing protein [Thermoplasmatales archaeon]